jgi:hypothetical protein
MVDSSKEELKAVTGRTGEFEFGWRYHIYVVKARVAS